MAGTVIEYLLCFAGLPSPWLGAWDSRRTASCQSTNSLKTNYRVHYSEKGTWLFKAPEKLALIPSIYLQRQIFMT